VLAVVVQQVLVPLQLQEQQQVMVDLQQLHTLLGQQQHLLVSVVTMLAVVEVQEVWQEPPTAVEPQVAQHQVTVLQELQILVAVAVVVTSNLQVQITQVVMEDQVS
jgi:ABC-type arginine transport system ATPase subunit